MHLRVGKADDPSGTQSYRYSTLLDKAPAKTKRTTPQTRSELTRASAHVAFAPITKYVLQELSGTLCT
eukprot:7420890-Pyramimonas_sp.AAC.1